MPNGVELRITRIRVDREQQIEMLLEHRTLLRDGWGFGVVPRKDRACLTEYPGVPDASTRDGNACESGVADHAEDLVDIPDISRSKDDPLWISFDECLERVPA